ncbi:MAG: Dyp-type peroxidase [Myxococcales bacterium]|nr:Dyp-type peroxidase [Myxococcales bacterium]
MATHQPGITEEVPALARYMSFRLTPEGDPRAALKRLAAEPISPDLVVGLGHATVAAVGGQVKGLREAKVFAGAGISVPATPTALWLWLRGRDRGELLHEGRRLQDILQEGFTLEHVVDAFKYQDGRDLSGYVDGTENPEGDEALAAAFTAGRGPGLDGGSFVAVQTWVHELSRFEAHTRAERDDIFGRRQADNEEFEEAPRSAHVKRTAQESFQPEAFVLRRSMPWADARREGLVFVAFGHTFDAFEAILTRMVGLEDGITDALFTFTHPEDTRYLWCPPLVQGRLDLSRLGLQ